MAIEVTARHIHATEEIQEYARGKGQLLEDEFPRVEHIHFVLDSEKHRQIATVVVQAKNRIRAEAKEESDNLRASIDEAVDKVERQLRRLRDKVQDHSPAMKHGEMDKERAL
ncbi:MAG: putative sigma-54 modulation protein [Candidatus Promineifilaceae bacterium]|jgi:putative sigma-54 modulation protein